LFFSNYFAAERDHVASTTSKLDQIVAEFSEIEPRERLELLSDFSLRDMPPLPDRYERERLSGQHRVHECQAEVYLWADVENDRIRIDAWASPQAPTARGFINLLIEAFNGSSAKTFFDNQPTLVRQLGLENALGMQRTRGLHAILHSVKRQLVEATRNGEGKKT
jgi:cysteine desulfuration protein SufE